MILLILLINYQIFINEILDIDGGTALKENKLIGNYIYSIINQLLNVIVPFITIPYIARVLGADGTGIYDYTYSYASVF